MKAPADPTIQTEHCSRLPTCVEEHHLLVDGEATPEMVEHYEQIGAYCSPCSRHFKELTAIKSLVQHHAKPAEAPLQLSEAILSKLQKE